MIARRLRDRRLLVAGAALLLAVGLAVYGGQSAARVWQIRQELSELERDLASLRARQRELSESVDRLRNDPHYLEKLAREEMGMVREGETVLKFPSHTPPPLR